MERNVARIHTAVLLEKHAKRTKKADARAAVIGAPSKAILGTNTCSRGRLDHSQKGLARALQLDPGLEMATLSRSGARRN
jgi:hypothetical protein